MGREHRRTFGTRHTLGDGPPLADRVHRVFHGGFETFSFLPKELYMKFIGATMLVTALAVTSAQNLNAQC